MEHIKDTLFLHMGPGFNSYIEKTLLGPHFPKIDFWDQPFPTTDKNAFQSLANQVEKKLILMSNEINGPINIVAHSFGGQLFEYLIHKFPDKISKGTIYNSSSNLQLGFVQLLKKMALDSTTNSDLRHQLSLFLNSGIKALSISNFINNFARLASQDPLFIRHYFYDSKKFNSYTNHSAQAPPLNPIVFVSVLTDYIENYFTSTSTYNGSQDIEIHISKSDPFFTPTCKNSWQKKFPNAKIKLHSSGGHFLHLEDHL